MADGQLLASTRSHEASIHAKSFGTSATPAYLGKAYSDYGFIAVLGLAQRLKIDLLPITWQALRGLIGQSRARINQALLSIQTSFAFKRFNHDNQSDPFRETVQEMAILGHPLVQNHPHIVQLIGICWDVLEDNESIPKDDQGISKDNQDISTDIQVWPVLVFEKSHLGDLYSFQQSSRGKDLSVECKLKICADVGIAIQDMHLNNIIHGDVKPQNVLIFEDGPGVYTAKVADFGLSTYFRSEKDLINMPITVPWNAPEHHGRAFYPRAAKAMDVYSFGMLCLWLLFSVESSEATPYPSGAVNGAESFSFKARDWSEKGDILLSWKTKRLLDWAAQSMAGDRRLNAEAKDRVTRFFQSSLCVDPQKRITNWGRMLSFLDPAREISNTATFDEIIAPKEEDFRIASSIFTLYSADFRLRSFVATKLKEIAVTPTASVFKHTLVAKAAEQLAFCYKIGFGVPKHGHIGKELPISQSQNGAVEREIRLIKNSESRAYPWNIGGHFDQFLSQGLVEFIGFHYYNNKGLVSRVETILRREIQDTTDVLGKKHWLNLALRGALALIYSNQGQWKEAEELEVQVMETRKRVFGEEHPDTLTSMANLASTYINQGRWKEAEELQTKELGICLRVLGKEHSFTLTSMANLALTYRNQGRWKEAEELGVQVMETRKRVLGDEHPSTLTSMANLASTYINQGRWKEAEELGVQVIETRKRVVGEEHPDTLISMANLASTYRNQGRWKEAEELQAKELEICSRVLGEEHPDTLTSMANLASTYRNQGRWKEAEELQAKELEICSRVLGEEHPSTLTGMANLASTYRNQGRWKEAKELFMQVMETRKRVLGEEHPDTLTSTANLASTYRNQGQWKEAEELFVQVIETRKKVLGEEHLSTLTSIGNLASTYSNQGRWKEAEELEEQVMETFKKVLGKEHPDTLTSMANLGSTYMNQGRWKEAEELQAKELGICLRVLGEEHPSTLTSMANLAFTLNSQGLTNKAILLMEDCCRLRVVVLGPQHLFTISSREALATWQLEAMELSKQNNA